MPSGFRLYSVGNRLHFCSGTWKPVSAIRNGVKIALDFLLDRDSDPIEAFLRQADLGWLPLRQRVSMKRDEKGHRQTDKHDRAFHESVSKSRPPEDEPRGKYRDVDSTLVATRFRVTFGVLPEGKQLRRLQGVEP